MCPNESFKKIQAQIDLEEIFLFSAKHGCKMVVLAKKEGEKMSFPCLINILQKRRRGKIKVCVPFFLFLGCSFPQDWEGIWFQSTVRPYITIDPHTISSKGECIRADIRGEKFIIKE